jgi:hypothetical protein
MKAIIEEIPGGFSTAVINDDMSKPTEEEQYRFMERYASAVLGLRHITATAGSNVTNIIVRRCMEREDN